MSTTTADKHYYDECCEGKGPVYSNSQVTMTGLNTGILSMDAGAPEPMSPVNSMTSSHPVFPGRGQGAMTQSGNTQDGNVLTGGTDERMSRLMDLKSLSSDSSHHINSLNTNVSRRSLTRSHTSSFSPGQDIATEIAKGFERTRQQSLPCSRSIQDPSMAMTRNDKLQITEKSMIRRIRPSKPQHPPPPVPPRPSNGLPPYDSVVACQSAEPTKDDSKASSHFVGFRSSNNLATASSSHYASAPVIPPSSDVQPPHLPSLCDEFVTKKSECKWQACPSLHVCAAWLSGRCSRLRRCRQPHSLRTAHNLTVLRARGWREEDCDTVRRWLHYQLCCQRLEAAHLPTVCINHARGICQAHPCDALHICQRFLIGDCEIKTCSLGHDLLEDENNRRVVSRSGNGDMPTKKLLKKMEACLLG